MSDSPDQNRSDSLKDAIEHLSSKRHVVSDEALKAKEELDTMRHTVGTDYSQAKALNKKLSLVGEFNDSVNLLYSIFKRSHFDELAYFVARPNRVLLLNFISGIMRGLGFGLGLLILFALIFYLAIQFDPSLLSLLD